MGIRWRTVIKLGDARFMALFERVYETSMKILLIEDDETTASYIQKGLQAEGFVVDRVADGHEGLLLSASSSYSLVIVDRMLPGMEGISIVKTLRGANVQTPILMLTALGGVNDRVEGLKAGADDYLTKPFSFAELSARCAALLRRPPMQTDVTHLMVGDLAIDLVTRRVTRAGVLLLLMPREFQLLEYMMRNEGKVLTRTMLLEAVWDINFDPRTNVVETHVSRLRSKVDAPFEAKLIQTVRQVGYRLAET